MSKRKHVLPILFVVFTMAFSGCATQDTSKEDTEVSVTESPQPSSTEVPTISPAPTQQTSGYTLTIDGEQSYEISELLYGLFLEDINFAIDGGLYAEMVKNRSFEYGHMANDLNFHGWSQIGDISYEIIDGSADTSYLNQNNTHYISLENSSASLGGISNQGFLNGLSIMKDNTYTLSIFLKGDYQDLVHIQFIDDNGTIYGEATIQPDHKEWWKYTTTITATATISESVNLSVLINQGSIHMDMISLFPTDTYQGRENGLRKDIATALEELQPKFLRFPGGCVVEGETLENAYNWKDSIGDGLEFAINGETTYGDVAARPLAENLWGDQRSSSKHPYYMTYGLGFYEYFLLCEDLKSEPVPIVNVGMSCQIQGVRSIGTSAQALDIDSEEFKQYIQDALDLVEFCNGDASTKYGAIRIAMGHEAPFDLKYLGIGNEQWGGAYFTRYEAFKEAFAQAAITNPALYGGIQLIVANGPAASDTYAWNQVKNYGSDYASLVDEHYYMMPSWFLSNTKRYDSYSRNSTKVFLGEYAAKSNTAEAALAEAAFMTGLERNGDVVSLAAYAPLFGNSVSYQWTPDLIWFKTDAIWRSVNYYVQQLFSVNKGSRVLSSTLEGQSTSGNSLKGKAGIGTWSTKASFDDILVINNDTKEVLYENHFNSDTMTDITAWEGNWSIQDGQLLQSNQGNPKDNVTGDVAYFGDTEWSNYTLTLTATKLSGNEGFLIPIAVEDNNNFYHWNLGGWNNTVSCLEVTSGGSKSGQIPETVRSMSIDPNIAYEIKIVVNGNSIVCYLNDSLMITYTIPTVESVYQVTSQADNGDLIVKIVNVSDQPQDILINLSNLNLASDTATLTQLCAQDNGTMNTLKDPTAVAPVTSSINIIPTTMFTAPKYSVSILRVPTTP